MTESKKIFVSPHIDDVRKDLNLPDQVYIFDTTLRDGEQTPGISFTLQEKLTIAKQLDKLGIDVIEAGMPIVSKGDYEACKKISKLGLNCEVIGLARIARLDIDKVIECDMDSIHVFIATSDLHLKDKLQMTREEILSAITHEIEYAKEHFKIIEFSAEDATRTGLDFLLQANKAAVEAGATRINVPDTVGTITPPGFAYIIRKLRDVLPKNIRISCHCHDDFGLSTANTLAGIEQGASQAHTTILGIGERAGNASMEEVVMSLYALYGIKTNINYKFIYETAVLLEQITNMRIPINFPLVGSNAFRHESGIHAHAVIMNPRTYEPIGPDLIGIPRSDEIDDVILKSIGVGKHSGGHAIASKLNRLGVMVDRIQLREIRQRIKIIGDKGKQVTDQDLLAIAQAVLGTIPQTEVSIELEELTVVCGMNVTPTATVKLKIEHQDEWSDHIASAIGVGPVDAACNALSKAFKRYYHKIGDVKLAEYNLEAITGGTDALGHVRVRLQDNRGFLVDARATHEDIVMSSVLAMINGLNRIVAKYKLELNNLGSD
ncbi:MAG: 2-isopropylmalate synthase [Candidatus Helarchaeota archaeon]|nr:2-isopropylmalate synthase [Candidatus Helarchaeota archaeon]